MKRLRLLFAALTLIVPVVAFAPPAAAATCDRQVSTSGSDANSGSPVSPWRHINYAGQHVSAGQTVCVANGTYFERVSFGTGGTSATNQVTFQNVVGATPVIDGSGVSVPDNSGLVVMEPGTNYFVFVGFTIQDSAERGLYNDGAHNVIAANTIQRSQNAGIITTNYSGDANSNTYSYNVITDNSLSQHCYSASSPNSDCQQSEQWEAAINTHESGTGASGGNVFTANLVYNNHGEGQTIGSGDFVLGNQFWDNWGVNVYFDGKHDSFVIGNVMYDTDTTDPDTPGTQKWRLISDGVGFSNESCPTGGVGSLHDDVVTNNFMLGVRHGVNFWNGNGWCGSNAKEAMVDHTIANNTIVNNWQRGIGFDPATNMNHSGTVVRNNIIWPRSGVATTEGVYNTTGITVDHMIRRGINTDPGLNGEGTNSHDVNDYKIDSTGSSAYNAGAVVAVVGEDYFGTARPQASFYDIGAHEK